MSKFFSDNWGVLSGILIAYLTLVIPIFKYLQDKRKQERNNRFNNYHKLIDDLLGLDKIPKLDRQMVIVFELRRFPEYFPVTKRVIKSLRQTWTEADLRILNELELTEEYIDSSKFERIFKFRKR